MSQPAARSYYVQTALVNAIQHYAQSLATPSTMAWGFNHNLVLTSETCIGRMSKVYLVAPPAHPSTRCGVAAQVLCGSRSAVGRPAYGLTQISALRLELDISPSYQLVPKYIQILGRATEPQGTFFLTTEVDRGKY
ncbi:hypothetical protein PWT90_07195 [Aphanocladium album]|nr:hypothetical protein PWT90_07195 [Aphanocladium album]